MDALVKDGRRAERLDDDERRVRLDEWRRRLAAGLLRDAARRGQELAVWADELWFVLLLLQEAHHVRHEVVRDEPEQRAWIRGVLGARQGRPMYPHRGAPNDLPAGLPKPSALDDSGRRLGQVPKTRETQQKARANSCACMLLWVDERAHLGDQASSGGRRMLALESSLGR